MLLGEVLLEFVFVKEVVVHELERLLARDPLR